MRIKFLHVSLLLLLASCGSNPEVKDAKQAAIPVLTTVAIVKDFPTYVEALGSLKPSISLEVRPQVSGVISQIFVEEGELVEAGTPLLKIDPASYEIKLDEVLAKLKTDSVALKSAERQLVRFQSLADKDLISQVEWDELETVAEKAKAAVDVDLAALKSASLDLSYCTICSCTKGRVGKLDAYPGLLVSNGQSDALLRVAKLDPLIVEFFLTEKDSRALSEESIHFDVLSLYSQDILGSGKVTFLDNHYDEKTGMIMVRGKVTNADQQLRPGQAVTIRLLVGMQKDAKIIPQKAVKYNQEGSYVYVVQEGSTVEMRPVTLGPTVLSDVIILKGLEGDDVVVTEGHLRLYPGSLVETKS